MANAVNSEPSPKIPVSGEFSAWQPPTNAEWAALADPHLIALRVAWLNVVRSPAENLKTAKDLKHEGLLLPLTEQLAQSAEFFELFVDILRAGHASLADAAGA